MARINVNVQDYGLQYLFPYQHLVVDNILNNEESDTLDTDSRRNQIVLLPTAAGKSLCFQLPAPYLAGVTIVIYPLLGLISDQGRRLQSMGIPYGELTGKISRRDKLALLENAKQKKVRVILTNPESILVPYILKQLREIPCSHLVIDEAHCISEWGVSFRPAYRELGTIPKEVPFRSVSAFTATASEAIVADIKSVLFNNEAVHIIRGNPDRENIHYRVCPTLSVSQAIIDITTRHLMQTPLIVFCPTRAKTMQYAQLIRYYTGNSEVFFYHAGLTAQEKERIEKWFFESPSGILCATCAYGMGMDKSNIRSVVHTALPPTIESYLQESGRGGRDGDQAWAMLCYSPATIHSAQAKNADNPLLPYITDHTTCRRALLLHTLGMENVRCNGCDVCDGERMGLSSRDRCALRYIRGHQRTMTIDQMAKKRALRIGGGFHDQSDAARYLFLLKEEGVITVSKRGFWKGSYSVAKQHRTGMRLLNAD